MGHRQGGGRGHYNNLNFFLLWAHTHKEAYFQTPRAGWGHLFVRVTESL